MSNFIVVCFVAIESRTTGRIECMQFLAVVIVKIWCYYKVVGEEQGKKLKE